MIPLSPHPKGGRRDRLANEPTTAAGIIRHGVKQHSHRRAKGPAKRYELGAVSIDKAAAEVRTCLREALALGARMDAAVAVLAAVRARNVSPIQFTTE
jgi:hypothetical protein